MGFGGLGGGPGEFRQLAWIQVLDSMIVAYDREQRRLTEFQRNGDVIQDWTLGYDDQQFRSPYAVGILADHSVIAVASSAVDTVRWDGVSRQQQILLRFQLGSSEADSLGTMLGPELYRAQHGGIGGVVITPILGRESAAVAQGKQVLIVDNTSPEPELLTLLPESVERARIGIHPASPVVEGSLTDDEWTRMVALRREAVPSRMRKSLDHLDNLPRPDAKPFYGQGGALRYPMAELSEAGQVWLKPYHDVLSEGPALWLVWDPKPNTWETILLPPHASLLAVGGSRVALLLRDKMGVERVEVWDVCRKTDIPSATDTTSTPHVQCRS